MQSRAKEHKGAGVMDGLIEPIQDLFKKGQKTEAIALARALLLDMKAQGASKKVLAGTLGAIFGAAEARKIWVNEFGWSTSTDVIDI